MALMKNRIMLCQSILVREVLEENAPGFLADQKLTFISDYQKGMLEGVQLSFSNSPHGYCMQHLYQNMHKEFKHLMLKVFLFKTAKVITKQDFDNALANINTIHLHALDWL